MRKETQIIAEAFRDGKATRQPRTMTDGESVWLHGNRIAWKEADHLCMCMCNWTTPTTRERLNGIMAYYNYFGSFSQKDGAQHFSTDADPDRVIGNNEVIRIAWNDIDMQRMEAIIRNGS